MRSRLPARDRYEKSPFKTKGSDIFAGRSRPRHTIFKYQPDQRELISVVMLIVKVVF